MVILRDLTLLTFILLPTMAWGGGILPATDLHQDGKEASRTGKPIVILVSAADCPYCEVLKDNVFIGMERDERIILRELATDKPIHLVDFDGSATNHQTFTSKQRLFFTPTVLFLDGTGRPLAKALVGVTNVDFYLYYLEQRIDKSKQILDPGNSAEIVID